MLSDIEIAQKNILKMNTIETLFLYQMALVNQNCLRQTK